MLADGSDHFVLGDSLAAEVRGDKLTVVNEDDGDTFDEVAHSHAAKPEASHGGVGSEECGGRDKPPLEGGVGADHGVLDSVGDEEDHDEIERGQLAELATAAEAQADEDRSVDGEGSSDDLDQVHEGGAVGAQIF